MNNNPICFFDSGIGGSTILKEVIKVLPNENYVYYPDTKNNPYGNKSKEELFKIVCNAVDKLLKYNPKLIVCACNTATTMVLDDIRKKYKDITFIGTMPAIKEIHDKYNDKSTIILATKGTLESSKFKEIYSKYKTPNSNIVKAPLLAELIEKNLETSSYLEKILKDYKNTDVVVLGCTHFPLVKNEIKKILGDVIFIDESTIIANKITKLIKNKHNDSSKKGSLKIIDTPLKTQNRIKKIIKYT